MSNTPLCDRTASLLEAVPGNAFQDRDAWEKVARRLEVSHAALVGSLTDALALMDEGYLVRNTKEDSAPDWAMRQLPYVRRLAALNTALEAAKELA